MKVTRNTQVRCEHAQAWYGCMRVCCVFFLSLASFFVRVLHFIILSLYNMCGIGTYAHGGYWRFRALPVSAFVPGACSCFGVLRAEGSDRGCRSLNGALCTGVRELAQPSRPWAWFVSGGGIGGEATGACCGRECLPGSCRRGRRDQQTRSSA